MSREQWWESDDPDRLAAGTTRLGLKTAAWITAGVLAISAAVGFWQWGTSDVRGQMEAQQQKNSAANRIQMQEKFQQRHQSILAADRNIQLAYDEKQANPRDQVAATNYSGLVRNCNDGLAQYNALARSFRAEEFRDADLPAALPDPANPDNTDCKENTR